MTTWFQLLLLSFLVPVSSQTYQVYSLRSAEDVYKRLTSQKTNYVIVEESICSELDVTKTCRVKDLLDVSNHHVRSAWFQ